MEEVRAHAQVYQDRSLREAQNSEMLIQCLKASITRTVYNKIYLQREEKNIITEENINKIILQEFNVEKYIATKQDTMHRFNARWKDFSLTNNA